MHLCSFNGSGCCGYDDGVNSGGGNLVVVVMVVVVMVIVVVMMAVFMKVFFSHRFWLK